MSDLCLEPRNDGDLYLLDGYPSMVYRNSAGWYIDGAEGTPDRGGVRFERVRHRLTLLARREDVGAVVLAAISRDSVYRLKEAGRPLSNETLCDADAELDEAAFAAKEHARG